MVLSSGLETLRERKQDRKLTAIVKTYSPGHLGLQPNADTPVIPIQCVYSLHLSMLGHSRVFSSGTRTFLIV